MTDEDKKFELFKIGYQAELDGGQHMFQSVMEAGATAIKSAFLLNGAATIALLALLGNITLDKPAALWNGFFENTVCATYCFAIATALVAIASGLRYLSQSAYQDSYYRSLTQGYAPLLSREEHEAWYKLNRSARPFELTGHILNALICCFVIASYSLFLYGVTIFGSTYGL